MYMVIGVAGAAAAASTQCYNVYSLSGKILTNRNHFNDSRSAGKVRKVLGFLLAFARLFVYFDSFICPLIYLAAAIIPMTCGHNS